MATVAEKQRAKELDNSRSLDVHKWSEHPEVNNAVDTLYEEFLELPEFKGKQGLQKKHIKVIVLDLYVRFLEDEEGYISFYRMKTMYKEKSRYNQLHITFISVAVIDNLEKLGYLEMIKGHYDRTGKRPSHMSRMRATNKLIDLIVNKHGISQKMIEKHPHTECIILRDEDKKDFNYVDTANTIALRNDLYAYNNLIRRSHIDVHSFPVQGVKSRSGDKMITLDRSEKFIRRIFNNSSWEAGGRYYGGWWQNIPKGWREHIRIDGSPVVEIDYSGLHIILLYGKENIDYWKEIGSDPYELEDYKHLKDMRGLLKQLLLTLMNADSKGAAIKAIRYEISQDKVKYKWFLDEGIAIEDLIDKFSETHKSIQKCFYEGLGVKLQYIDSRIAERVINQLTKEEIPVLCVHDSFIIAKEHKDKLYELMVDSFNEEIPITLPRVTDNINPFLEGYVPWTDFNSMVLIEEDPTSKESRELERRLREHQSIEWTKVYYKENI